MKRWLTFVALLSLWPHPAPAQPPFGRQLHYAGTRVLGDDQSPVTIDVDIGRADSDVETWIVIDEHVGDRDLGPLSATLDRSGVRGSNVAKLTLEEEAILDMVALQFEDVDGVSAGDHWKRSGTVTAGSHETHYRVLGNSDGMVDLDVSRSMEFDDGGSGSWRGVVKYNSTTVAPTSIEFAGELTGRSQAQRALRFSANLVGDSFVPRSADDDR